MTDPKMTDQNAALAECRGIVDGSGVLSHEDPWDTLQRFRDAFEALDEHLNRGGVLPKAWQNDEIVRRANEAVREAAERYAEAKRGQPMTWAQKLAGSREKKIEPPEPDAVREATERHEQAIRRATQRNHEWRECAGGCGLPAAEGDVFCAGCREGHDRG